MCSVAPAPAAAKPRTGSLALTFSRTTASLRPRLCLGRNFPEAPPRRCAGPAVAARRGGYHNGGSASTLPPAKGPAMPRHLSRRQFLGSSAALVASGYFVSHLPAQESKSPSERLNIA